MGQINKTTAEINQILDRIENVTGSIHLYKHIITLSGEVGIQPNIGPEADFSSTCYIEIVNAVSTRVQSGTSLSQLFNENPNFNPLGSVVYDLSNGSSDLVLSCDESNLYTTNPDFNVDISGSVINDWVIKISE